MSTVHELEVMTEVEKIQWLASRFHVLAHRQDVWNWDACSIDRWAAGGASHGERLAVQFILGVWNQYDEWQCGRFDVIEAMQCWDAEMQSAFLQWAQAPFVL